MDPKFLKYYNGELQHIREMFGEFAKEYPKIAGRLGMDGFDCADPYVERLLEGFGYMAARVQLKVDAEFPRFTQHLLDMVYPHFLSPTPSMVLVQFTPKGTEGSLVEGYPVSRHTTLMGQSLKEGQTQCQYSTANEVVLWPIEVAEAEYLTSASAVAATGVQTPPGVKGAIRIRLQTTADLKFNQLAFDELVFYMHGLDRRPVQLIEQMLANSLGVVAKPASSSPDWQERLPASAIQAYGLEEDQALLPFGPRSFQGYRLLKEHFAFPERNRMLRFTGLRPSVARCEENTLDLFILLNRLEPELAGKVEKEHFALFCTPAVNLFKKHADRIHLNHGASEYHIVPDRSRPMDYEVFDVLKVTGYGAGTEESREFLPFYSLSGHKAYEQNHAYFTLSRRKRVLSERARQRGPRSSYSGGEVYVSLVDANEAPLASDLRQLGLEIRCTNRDLPLFLSVGKQASDFTLNIGGPIEAVRCLAGPTPPTPSLAEGDVAWRLISHLSLNYLSITGNGDAGALRELLGLYGAAADSSMKKQIEGLVSVDSKPVHRRIPSPGPISFGRGLEVTVTFDESAFEGSGVLPLGLVLERFFSHYTSVNSFAETVLKTVERGEIVRWAPRLGERDVL